MTVSEIDALNRAHQMFVGSTRQPKLDADTSRYRDLAERAAGLNSDAIQSHYQLVADRNRQALRVRGSNGRRGRRRYRRRSPGPGQGQ